MKVNKIGSKLGRSPKKFSQFRSCKYKNCKTTLSIYNKKTFCFIHSPVSYPRVRGHLGREQGE